MVKYEHDKLLGPVVAPMKRKFLKYWSDIPILYSFAFFLDPIAKLKFFNSALSVARLTGADYISYSTSICSGLTNIYTKYETKFGAVRLRKPSEASQSSKKKTTWSTIMESTEGDEEPLTYDIPTSTYPSHGSELLAYLESEPISVYDNDDFDIINWWQEHKKSYPVLSILAKDVLVVPVSTISSESTFSLTGRVLEDRRGRLTSDMVEILTCLKDWYQAEDRSQHTVEAHHLQLESSFKDQYLDDNGEERNVAAAGT